MVLNLHIILQSPPNNTTYSLQKGSGNNYQVEQVQTSNGTDLHFTLTVVLKDGEPTDDLPDFKGPFVQGPRGGRFIYLDIGSYAGANGQWSGRLKIPLTGITWQLVSEINAAPDKLLSTKVPGTGKNGLPNCATVKPFLGWRLS